MRKLTIVLFLSLMTFVDFASAESIVIGPKIGITYPLSLETSNRYSSPWQNFGAFVRFEEGNFAVQGEFEYLRSKTMFEFRGFLGRTYWTTSGEVSYLATPFWL